MNAPSQTLICNPQIEWSELLSSVSFRPFHVSLHLSWLCECRCAFDHEKMLKVGRKKKEKKRKKEKKHTNSVARIRARASPPAVIISFGAWNFTTQPKKQNTRYHRSLNINTDLKLGWTVKWRTATGIKIARFGVISTYLSRPTYVVCTSRRWESWVRRCLENVSFNLFLECLVYFKW